VFGIDSIVYRLLSGFVLLAAIFTAGVFVGWRGPHNALIQYRTQVEQAAADQARIAWAKDAENERVKKETEDAYQTQLNSTVGYWTRRMRNYSCASGLPKDTGTTSKPNGPATDSLPPDYPKLIEDCSATTVQIEALQKWVRDTR
jgi:hypothetical protein